ncbi:hypothetical protein [Streptomyces sp. NBC_01669]|uniref:hypothetical protein n=1 Tax=Streptomyces sp. NBC_01669 TaxID=2975909 RepID=UPI002253ACBD|nr:hypothetical protein [Streptomyces sp. NBC_01669]MCX4537895.1 hypothetical protein [Streptomyces sp. NBC_01669]
MDEGAVKPWRKLLRGLGESQHGALSCLGGLARGGRLLRKLLGTELNRIDPHRFPGWGFHWQSNYHVAAHRYRPIPPGPLPGTACAQASTHLGAAAFLAAKARSR